MKRVLICVTLACVLAVAFADFGHSMLSYFTIASDYTNFNHGSYGCSPKPVQAAQQQFVAEMESRPDPWFRVAYREYVATTRTRIAQ